MHQAQLLVYEADGRLAGLLRELAAGQKWLLREVRHPESCLRLLKRGGVLVLKLGRDLTEELTLLEQTAWLCPDAATVVVGDSDCAELAGLAWDLGARLVLFPPQPRQQLPEIVSGLMAAVCRPG